ncbi:MAG: uroporphyrinogen-III C-methyltransferase [Sedimentisphaerales bacterium]|nr:uroporphyrinogen-III C-methyltransferase [Sedimentisphaerales bacterium]
MSKGFVYLVGAGPGRADLITVRGAEVLGKADCIIYDKLANPALLRYARAGADIIHVPKRIGSTSVTQKQINRLLIEKASGGRIVVRLKGGDPCIFGRIAEEIAAISEAGIDFEIVPGITAGIAVSSYTGIMLTDRQYSSQVVFVTGREAEGKKESNIDWSLLAKYPGTIVFYMGMGNLDFIAGKLIENGMSENTPAAVVTEVTFPTQEMAKAPLSRIGDECRQNKIGPPAIIIIGEAADSDKSLGWFTKLPLFGKNIVVTRDSVGNADFAQEIIARGGNPISFDTFKIVSLTDSNEFLRALTEFADYDWIVFTSGNGVTVFFEALGKLGKDARVFGSAKVAAIGDRTAERLLRFGIKADFVPNVFTSGEFGKQLLNFTSLRDKKVLLLRSQIASNELVELLQKGGAAVKDVAIYTAVTQKHDSDWLSEKIDNDEIDWLTFASPSSVEGFFETIGSETVRKNNVKVASIGPVTSRQLESHGLLVDIEADEHTLIGLLEAIEKTYK